LDPLIRNRNYTSGFSNWEINHLCKLCFQNTHSSGKQHDSLLDWWIRSTLSIPISNKMWRSVSGFTKFWGCRKKNPIFFISVTSFWTKARAVWLTQQCSYLQLTMFISAPFLKEPGLSPLGSNSFVFNWYFLIRIFLIGDITAVQSADCHFLFSI